MTLSLTDIGIGSAANDGTGDTPRAAGQKINANNAAIIAYLKALANLDTVGTAQIDNGAVTLAKMASIANGTILGNVSGGAAPPAALTASQVKTLLAISTSDVSGLGSFATISSLAFSSLTSKPTTLSGYGITDAYTSTQVDTLLGSYLTTATAATAYQPLDSDLTAIAALTTTSFGRSVLTWADAAAGISALGITAVTPGGSDGQVQYNNAGAFGGVTGLTLTTGTLAAATFAGAANSNIIAATGYSLTGANAQSLIDLAGTWDTSGTPTAIKLNVTDTASNAASLLMDLQVGGASKAQLQKNGVARFIFAYLGTNFGTPAVSINAINDGFIFGSSVGAMGFTSTSDGGGTPDVLLRRDAANTLALRNSTNAQTFNVYNTYTDSSNYERGFFGWSSNELIIGTTYAGTGSSRPVRVLGGAAITGASLLIDCSSGISYIRGQYNSSTRGAIAFGDGGGNDIQLIPGSGGIIYMQSVLSVLSATAIPAGGTTGSGIKVSSTSNFGVFFGSGAPTLSAAKGSLYLRSDGSTTNDRMYVNSDGSTTWTAVTTAA